MVMAYPQKESERDWESQFKVWAQPPSQSELERCERSVNAIKKAVANSSDLLHRSIRTFAQGSYANRTNVRQDSDVDVCVLCRAVFFYELPAGLSAADIGIQPATYLYPEYKDQLERALVDHFGRENVRRGNKAFDIHENTYRVDADAVACFLYRLYFFNQEGRLRYYEGTGLRTDDEGKLVTNFPEQQYDNGVVKNDATDRRFKALVRVIKNLRNEMGDAGIVAAEPIASFLIESLVWNWPNEMFDQSSWVSMVKAFLAFIWVATKTEEDCRHWTEINGIKSLFGSHNEWNYHQVHVFAEVAYTYIDSQ